MGGLNWGRNLQNCSDEERRLVIPDKGKVFIQVDQAGAEALIVAREGKPGKFLDCFLNKVKPHTFTAARIYLEPVSKELGISNLDSILRLPIAEMKKTEEWKVVGKSIKETPVRYAVGKMTCHSSNYGIQAKALALRILVQSGGAINLSIKEVSRILEIYRVELFPEIPLWNAEIKSRILSTKVLRNLFGYPRYFPETPTEKLFLAANAFIPQSTVGTITNIAFCEMQDYIEKNSLDWDLLNNCHDSILLQTPEEEKEEGIRVLQEKMEMPLTSTRGEKYFMRTEAAWGFNWGKYDEEKNVLGLKEI